MSNIDLQSMTSEDTARVWKKLKCRGIKTQEELDFFKKLSKRHEELTGFSLPKPHLIKELKW